MERRVAVILQKCKKGKQVKQTHVQILINGLKGSNFLAIKLMTLSSEFISLDYAAKVFDDLRTPDLISYNPLIKCSIGSSIRVATTTYNRMREKGISSNSYTLTFLLRCYESFNKFELGERVHGHVLRMGIASGLFVMNTLMDLYAKCGGSLDIARKVLDEMPERDIVTWNTMIRTYMSNGDIDTAVKLFESMPDRNLVSGLAKIGNMESAKRVFQDREHGIGCSLIQC
ncbi:pentatricopeptide repeat-containing protein At3g29230-like [Andrographis paniculata]|uniref:pentatricopeptide repeat-containing protein At3g29230-like n=1 Tax=Andrographis paniculata TaxID=175694 RepID=UPI0021E7227B|nr:pentatricopeptide repeat-containing protein At3g29230-like [Andrographis paniculata]